MRDCDDPSLTWIRAKLTQWGRVCRAVGIGYATMSSHEKARIGRGGAFYDITLPPDLVEIDVAVTRALPQHKLVLVEIYTKGQPWYWRDHAARLQLGKDAYFARKKTAEVYLNRQLTEANGNLMLRTG